MNIEWLSCAPSNAGTDKLAEVCEQKLVNQGVIPFHAYENESAAFKRAFNRPLEEPAEVQHAEASSSKAEPVNAKSTQPSRDIKGKSKATPKSEQA